jgi:hypothetical protein
VEPLTLPVCTFHGIGCFKVHPFGYPALRAVGKRRGFHKFPSDPEFPAVDAEPAVLGWLLFIHVTGYHAPGYRQNAIVVVGHINLRSFVLLRVYFTCDHIKPENLDGKKEH